MLKQIAIVTHATDWPRLPIAELWDAFRFIVNYLPSICFADHFPFRELRLELIESDRHPFLAVWQRMDHKKMIPGIQIKYQLVDPHVDGLFIRHAMKTGASWEREKQNGEEFNFSALSATY